MVDRRPIALLRLGLKIHHCGWCCDSSFDSPCGLGVAFDLIFVSCDADQYFFMISMCLSNSGTLGDSLVCVLQSSWNFIVLSWSSSGRPEFAFPNQRSEPKVFMTFTFPPLSFSKLNFFLGDLKLAHQLWLGIAAPSSLSLKLFYFSFQVVHVYFHFVLKLNH
jgi:hypothetical protein